MPLATIDPAMNEIIVAIACYLGLIPGLLVITFALTYKKP
jgi:hypothetical protein